MGLAPGYCAPLRLQALLLGDLAYGTRDFKEVKRVEDLNRVLLGKTNHTGSDGRVTTGQILNPRAFPHHSISALWFSWEPIFKVRWKMTERINALELRNILMTVKYCMRWSISIMQASRLFHVSDS